MVDNTEVQKAAISELSQQSGIVKGVVNAKAGNLSKWSEMEYAHKGARAF